MPGRTLSRRSVILVLSAVVGAALLIPTMPATATPIPAAAAAPGATPAPAVAPQPAAPITPGAGDPAHPTYLGKTFYTGEFHAHTSVSDGVQTPKDAFEHVRANSNADFFTLSEHDVLYDRRNSDDFTTDWHDATSEEWRYLHQESDDFNASQQDLVTIPAEEMTWYDTSGHMNVFNTDWLTTARAEGDSLSFGAATGDLKYDLPTFYARLKQDPNAIAQFNHPDPSGKGAFFGFKHLDRAVDDRIDLIEVKNDVNRDQFRIALDAGWHLAPVWNGDEHGATWVTGDESITGVWATGKSREAVYAAMKDRSMYSTQDVNTVLEYGANGKLMGSMLPADTAKVDLDIALTDPDTGEAFSSVQVLTNGGRVAYEAPGVGGPSVHVTPELPAADGDYFYVQATQTDGDVIVSAPVWIGRTTRGADYAPTITFDTPAPATAGYGQRIQLPTVTATDDSGKAPTVSYEVWDDAGTVPVTDGGFTVRSLSDHVIVVKATDAAGNVGAELRRIRIDLSNPDAAGAFRYFGSAATVGEQPDEAGLSVNTDATVGTVYAQVRRTGHGSWQDVPVLTSTHDTTYEINTVGKQGAVYQDTVTGQPLRSHEFTLSGLKPGWHYEYRFGTASRGRTPGPRAGTWSDVKGSFTTQGRRAEPIYLLGDLAADSRRPADLQTFRTTLKQLQRKAPGGNTLVQTGDLVASGIHSEYWQDAFEHALSGLDLQLAPVVGDGESDYDREYNLLSAKRNQIFSSMYALPDQTAVGESNYSFDRADVHISVLNTEYDLDTQLAWLVQDVRAAHQPWNVVVGHRSYFGGKGSEGPGMTQTRDKISTVFGQLGIDVYIGGHDNVYQRSTIYQGRPAKTPAEIAAATTFVTLGSAGPRFGSHSAKPWDDVVDDTDTQMGTALQATGSTLNLRTYAADGRPVDVTTLTRPQGIWSVSSAAITDEQVSGVGLLSNPGSPATLTVEAVTTDATGQQVTGSRMVRVTLDHRGAEQWIAFDSPLPVGAADTVTLHFWDSPQRTKQLRAPLVLREALLGAGTADSPYLLDSADDLDKIVHDLAAHYRLTKDLDLGGTAVSPIGVAAPFTGELDGAGHILTGLTSGHGGLIGVNAGSIHDLGLSDADIAATTARAGVLADTNTGTIERVWTGGLLTGPSRTGGIVGDQAGVLRDAYSTARVQSFASEAGGVAGVALAGSTTERVYAAGPVGASAKNAGGVAGYGYTGTLLRDALALNPTVDTPSFGHRVIGRVLDGNTATLTNNWAGEQVAAAVPGVAAAPAADNVKGATASTARTKDATFYSGTLHWNLDTVWSWNAAAGRPVLRSATEIPPPGTDPGVPALPRDADGAYRITTVADLKQLNEFPGQRYRLAADLDLSGAQGLALARSGFAGELDGAGYRVSGLTSTTGGLFPLVAENGRIHDLALDAAAVETTAANVGLLVDTNRGTVERVSTSGTIYGGSTVGGVVGYSYGVLRDSFSTADVYATGGRQAGGVAGITGAGSLTEYVYATGHVEVVGNANAGGISGYAYTGTTLRHAMALNSQVVGTGYAHRVVARVLAGNTATLTDNAASEDVDAATQSEPAVGPATLNGATRSRAEAADQATYQAMGWDFQQVWTFDADSGRPQLRTFAG